MDCAGTEETTRSAMAARVSARRGSGNTAARRDADEVTAEAAERASDDGDGRDIDTGAEVGRAREARVRGAGRASGVVKEETKAKLAMVETIVSASFFDGMGCSEHPVALRKRSIQVGTL